MQAGLFVENFFKRYFKITNDSIQWVPNLYTSAIVESLPLFLYAPSAPACRIKSRVIRFCCTIASFCRQTSMNLPYSALKTSADSTINFGIRIDRRKVGQTNLALSSILG